MLKLESNNLVEVLNHIQLSGLWGLTSQTSGPDFNNKNVRTISPKTLVNLNKTRGIKIHR